MSSEELLDKCENNETEEAIRLIEAGVDINKPDTSGFTALMTSCLNNNEKIVDKLLEYGADVNVNIESMGNVNALKIAYFDKKNKDLILKLIKAVNKDILNLSYQDEHNNTSTLLMYSCDNNDEDIAFEIINNGANLDIQDNNGKTALMVAIERGHENIAEKLIGAGANLNLQDKNRATALILASFIDNQKIVKMLLDAKNRAEVNTNTKPAAADGRRSKKKYRKKTPRKKIKSSSTHHDKKSKKQCKDLLQKKIRINILEFKKGRWKSPKQAVAVSYSQIRKRFPECLFPRKK